MDKSAPPYLVVSGEIALFGDGVLLLLRVVVPAPLPHLLLEVAVEGALGCLAHLPDRGGFGISALHGCHELAAASYVAGPVCGGGYPGRSISFGGVVGHCREIEGNVLESAVWREWGSGDCGSGCEPR